MAPPRSPSWRHLLPGIIISGVLASVALAVLIFARVGQLRGSTIELTVVAPSARDLQEGSEVWLAGQRVGVVDEIRFRPPDTDTLYRVALVTRILSRAAPLVRADSRAEIGRGGTVLGAPVLTLGAGTANARPVEHGDTLRIHVRPGVASLLDELAPATRSVPAMRRELAAIRTATATDVGTVGAVIHGAEIARTRQLVTRLRALTGQFTTGRGVVPGVLRQRSELRQRAATVAARADSVQRLLDSDAGTLGRFRRDTTIHRELAAVRLEVDSIRGLLRSAEGTAGRTLHDGILQVQLDSISVQLRLLADDLRRRPLRYLNF